MASPLGFAHSFLLMPQAGRAPRASPCWLRQLSSGGACSRPVGLRPIHNQQNLCQTEPVRPSFPHACGLFLFYLSSDVRSSHPRPIFFLLLVSRQPCRFSRALSSLLSIGEASFLFIICSLKSSTPVRCLSLL